MNKGMMSATKFAIAILGRKPMNTEQKSLRDEFAMHAMAQGMATFVASKHNMNEFQLRELARSAYIVADAMMKERSQQLSEREVSLRKAVKDVLDKFDFMKNESDNAELFTAIEAMRQALAEPYVPINNQPTNQGEQDGTI